MVSRTPRHSSQPRPSMPGRTSSNDGWDRNSNANRTTSTSQQRRAQSSMRYQSNGRNSSRSSSVRDGTIGSMRHQSSQSKNNDRPRAISTSRLRQPRDPMDSHDDPSAVARQILDLRERRESTTRNKRPAMPPGISKRPSSIPSHITTQKSDGSSPPTGLLLKSVGSSMSHEEIQAEERLKRAENKIGGLLQELEELKFFQEIEMETPAPNTPRAPRVRGSSTTNGGPPKTVRTSSPARAARPRPPSSNNNQALRIDKKGGEGGALETYKPMSPRSIAKLDRNSLELECQTIVRKLQILEQERFTHEATIEMYEISLQEHDHDKSKVQRLEGELQKLSTELKKQLYNIKKGKESLVKDYEEKLQNNLQKLHRTQEKADSYKAELEAARNSAGKVQNDVEKYRGIANEKKRRVEELLSNEEALQLQLEEAQNLNTTLVKKVEKKRSEVSCLKEDLSSSNKFIEEKNRDQEDAYESRIVALEQQLDTSKNRYSRLEQECTERNATFIEKENELNEIKIKLTEYECKMEALEKHADVRFEEGKKASKSLENRKAQELVSERANTSREYERRLKAMQEQLRHQTDRHHKEIEETRERNQKNLESMKEHLREEIRETEGNKVNRLELNLSSLKRSYDEEKLNYSKRLQDAQQKARETTDEFQRHDEIRQKELDHLHERLRSYINDFEEKDNQIVSLKGKIENQELVREKIEKEYSVEREKHEELFEAEKVKFAQNESKLNDKISTLRATYSDLEGKMVTDIQKLREQIDEGRNKLLIAEKFVRENEGVKEQLEKVQATFTDTREELLSERVRVKDLEAELKVELAKLNGQLRASESALLEKKSQIDNFSRELESATAVSSKDVEEKSNQIMSLKKELGDVASRLENNTIASETKDTKIQDLYYENRKLKESLSDMRKVEDNFQDVKRKLVMSESEKRKNSENLYEVKSQYESMRVKVTEVEKRHSDKENEFDKRLETKENLLERCDKTIKNLEFDLDKERQESNALKQSVSDLESEKRRNEYNLASIRKDYEDLTGLLEQNLHSSVKKDELDVMLRRKENEMKDTVNIYNRQLTDLEDKIRDHVKKNEELQMKNDNIQTFLDKMKADKNKIFNDLTNVQKNYDTVCIENEELKDERDTAVRGIHDNIDKNDNHLREAVQRYTRTIANLEAKLEEENQSKLEVEDRLSSARSELEDKQKQTQEIVHRHAKATMKLESNAAKTSTERELLKAELDQTKKAILKKELELSETVEKYKNEIAFLESTKQSHGGYRELSDSSREDLKLKENQITKLKQTIQEIRKELIEKSTESDRLKNTLERNETELKQRKDQISELITKYTDQISTLEAKLDDHSAAKTTTEDKVESVQAQASRKDSKIKDLMIQVADLESRLEISTRNKDAAKQKSESLFKELDEKESKLRSFEVEKIEIETKLHTQSRSKDELRSKMTELSSRLERKEREVREISDRYKIYVMELESKLDQDTNTKHHLQLEIDNLRNNLDTASVVSSEALDLRKKVDSLEITLKNSKAVSESLQHKIEDSTKSKALIEKALKKANSEKAEVIAALEGVINEVQNREDEIENLSELLQRRDEELQHAKIIATKALQSAKDIQKRYKDKDEGRHSDLMSRMNEVSDNVDRLTTKNESLQRKVISLERELRDKNLECKRLKDQLRQIDGKQMRENNMIKDDISAISTQSTEFTNFSVPVSSCDDMGIEVNPLLDSGSFSPSNNSGGFSRNVEFPHVEKQYSKDSVDDDSHDGARWGQDFESDSRSGIESLSSEQISTKSRRSVERDALRKYVRQRYSMKRGEKPF